MSTVCLFIALLLLAAIVVLIGDCSEEGWRSYPSEKIGKCVWVDRRNVSNCFSSKLLLLPGIFAGGASGSMWSVDF